MNTCVMAAILAGMTAVQPVQWRVADGGNGHWYERVPRNNKSWTTLQAEASMSAGYLATLTTSQESAFVIGVMAGERCLLGGHQNTSSPAYSEPSGGWMWANGESIAWQSWANGEPNNYWPWGEDIMGAYPDGRWVDLSDREGDLGWPVHFAVREHSADCNNDGIVDKGQVLSGELADTNNNGIPDAPGIAVQPTDQSVGVDSPVTFIVEVAASTCATPVTYQWQRRNPAVADPAAANAWVDVADGGGFFGTRAPNLSISRPIPALATGYRCKIGGGCGCEPNPGGFVYTNTVNFSVACPADFNADGGIDFGDVEAFFERWENGC